jgi:hypothetical protein
MRTMNKVTLACLLAVFLGLFAHGCSSNQMGGGSETHFVACNVDSDCVSLGAAARCQGGECRSPVADSGSVDVDGTTSPSADGSANVDTGESSSEAAVDAAEDAGTTSIEPYCDPNPPAPLPGCPASEPAGGSACTETGLRCIYPAPYLFGDGGPAGPFGVAVTTCLVAYGSGQLNWFSSAATCREDCAKGIGADAGVPLSQSVPCAERPHVACLPGLRGSSTRQETLDAQLSEIAGRCGQSGLTASFEFWIGFEGGCATVLDTGGTDSPGVASCMAAEFGSSQFDCATDRACGVAYGYPLD